MNPIRKNSAIVLASLALLGTSLSAASVVAENAMQTIHLGKVDVLKVSTGYRTSKLIGSDVMSDGGETIGKIDDLIVSPDDNKSAYVIISVGGWLGMGARLVALPYGDLRINNAKITLPGVTKEALKGLPEFKFSTM